MTIEFLLDNVSDKDKKEIKNIIRALKNRKTRHISKEALFLRKFILALMKQYSRQKPKRHESPQLKVSIPRIMQQQVEAPSPLGIYDEFTEAPKPLMFEEQLPHEAPAPEPLTLEDAQSSLDGEHKDLEPPSPINVEGLDAPTKFELKIPDSRSVNEEIKRELKAPRPN